MSVSSSEVKEQLVFAFASELSYAVEETRIAYFEMVERFYRTGFQDFWAIDRVDDYMTPNQALSIDIRITLSAVARFMAWLELELGKDEPAFDMHGHSLAVDYVTKRVGSLNNALVKCWGAESTLLGKYLPQASVYNDNKAVSDDGERFFMENIWLGVFYLFLVLGCGTELRNQIEQLQSA